MLSEREERQIAELKKNCFAYDLKIGVVSILFIGYSEFGYFKDIIIRG